MTRNSKIQASRNVNIIYIKAPNHKYNSIPQNSNKIAIIIIDNFCVVLFSGTPVLRHKDWHRCLGHSLLETVFLLTPYKRTLAKDYLSF